MITEITYEWFKLDDDGNRIQIDEYEIMDEAKVINFKDEYIKNKLFSANPQKKFKRNLLNIYMEY